MTFALVLALAAFEPEPLIPGNPWVLRGHTDGVTAIAFSPNSAVLASASRDKSVKLWDLKTGELLRSISCGEQQLSSLSFSKDGSRLAVGDTALQVSVLNVETGAVLGKWAHPDAVGAVAFSPDGARVAVAGVVGTGAVYEWASGAKKFEFRGRTVQYTPDGKALLISSGAGAFHFLDAKSGKVRKTVSTSPDLPLTTLSIDGKRIASWTAAGVDVRLWTEAGKQQAVLKGPPADYERRKARVTGTAFAPDGKRLVVGGGDGLVRLWNIEKSEVVQSWLADKNSAVTISGDGQWLAVADSALIKLWKMP